MCQPVIYYGVAVAQFIGVLLAAVMGLQHALAMVRPSPRTSPPSASCANITSLRPGVLEMLSSKSCGHFRETEVKKHW